MGNFVYVNAMIRTEETGQVLKHLLPEFRVSTTVDKPSVGPESFADLLAQGVNRVTDLSQESDRLQVDLALGKPVELHQVMLAATKAQIAMELLIEIRNKLIEAYQEISRMPV